ncbi:MAG: nitroreductase family protein [bacterium]|nr:nitroreductase family protein [bacterium]MDT8367540.1 nitroreductase family protein [bacterium]
MFKQLVERNRSYRRFDESHRIDEATLMELVDLARLTPSSANLQPLKYMISSEPVRNELIFPHLKWAGYLKDWPGPVEGERPSAYIIVLRDTTIFKADSCDHGIASQTILLGAVEKGLGGCMIGNLDMDGLRSGLGIGEHLHVLLVLPLGKPVEEVHLVPVGQDGDMKYWRDEQGVHHVPKRNLEEIIV